MLLLTLAKLETSFSLHGPQPAYPRWRLLGKTPRPVGHTTASVLRCWEDVSYVFCSLGESKSNSYEGTILLGIHSR
jgi:hypothetical protein